MIFPTQCSDSAPQAEKQVYNLLKAEFESSENISVFHEVRIQASRERNREYEIDFVVASAKYILCIEVKGGRVDYDSVSKSWTQNGHKLSSPIDQAIENKHGFINRFRQDLNEIQVYWAVCFPDVTVSSKLPTEANDINVIDSDKLRYINEYFKSIESSAFSLSREDRFPTKNANYALKRIIGSLTRGFGFEPSIQSKLDANEFIFAELLAQQLEVISGLADNDKLMIRGNAGTGKSLVGLHQLFSRYELNERVLFLTFNRPLAKNFSYLVRRDFSVREEDEIEITNFHQFARKIITHFEPTWWDLYLNKDENFWDLEVPSKLDECLPHSDFQFDCIIVDEAQDFMDIWLDPIMKLLSQEGKISLLMDGKQDIYGRSSHFLAKGFLSFKLDRVIRSSKRNTEFVNEFLELNLKSHSRVPVGNNVIDFRKEDDKVNMFNQSIDSHGIKPYQVIFIYEPDQGLLDFENYSRGRLRISRNRDTYAGRGQISAVSIRYMKGLESDIIAIVGIDKMQAAEQYVALTRAKSLIYLL